MLQFSRIKKMCLFKRETFCIIQRKNEIGMVKRFFFQFHSLQKFCKVWYPILQKLFKVWWLKRTEILRVLTSSMVSNDAEILNALTSTQCCRNSAGNDILCCRNFMCCKVQCKRNFESLLFHSQKRHCRGPTHTNSFDQFSFYAFAIYQWS